MTMCAGSLQEVLQIHDVLARVYLARLCYILSSADALDGKDLWIFGALCTTVDLR